MQASGRTRTFAASPSFDRFTGESENVLVD